VNAGFGYFPTPDKGSVPIVGIPVTFCWNVGSRKAHLELGAGLTYSSGIEQEEILSYPTLSHESKVLRAVFGTMRVGFRYQNPEGGLFFKVGFTPAVKLVDLKDKFSSRAYGFPGLALGYSF